ncbi:hypothetical protein QUF72_00105 [Desulfobacterales bacterium HSG2]|nr:hypothetical protein [Desulfobacterales bacterium HSG2]
MQFYTNELSLEGQYESIQNFIRALETVYKAKREIRNFGYRLFCDRRLSLTICVRTKDRHFTFEQAVLQTKNKNLIRNIRGWIAKSGPFLEEADKLSVEEYLQDEFDNIVSGSSVAEAAWRTKIGQDTHVISFSPSTYNKSPLYITWFKNNGKTDQLSTQNFWEIKTLINYLKGHAEAPKSWNELIRQCENKYKKLCFSDELINMLTPHPFVDSIARRTMELLRILNELSVSFDEDDQLGKHGHEIITNYFHGDNALFSDESDKNKTEFKEKLTFIVPKESDTTKKEISEKKIFCPWHGKIKHKQYRIHFSWPKKKKEPLYIVYIGPKITKE